MTGIAKAMADKMGELEQTYRNRIVEAETEVGARRVAKEAGEDHNLTPAAKERVMQAMRERAGNTTIDPTPDAHSDLPVPVGPAGAGPLMPVATAKEMRAAMVAWAEIVKAIEMPGDVVMIGKGEEKKPYRKVSFYRRAAAAYNLTVRQLSKMSTSGFTATGEKPTAEVHLRITAPNGRYVDSVGLASGREPNRGDMSEHAIVSLAWSRAFSRGCRVLIGFGEPIPEDAREG